MPDYSKIPQEMKRERRWLVFKLSETTHSDGTKRTMKQPVNPNNLYAGSSTNPERWSDFDTAVACVGKHSNAYYQDGIIAGIGFALGGGWAGLDLDGTVGHVFGGYTEDVLKDIHDTLGTYAEISVSGGGYHFYGRYHGPRIGQNPQHSPLEIYTDGRFFTVTGNQWGDYADIADITQPLQQLRNKYFGEPDEETEVKPKQQSYEQRVARQFPVTGNPNAKGNIATGLTKDVMFSRLFSGDEEMMKQYNPSVYDAKLMSKLVYWVGENCAACIKLFAQSPYGKKREGDKILRADYLPRTYFSAVEFQHKKKG